MTFHSIREFIGSLHIGNYLALATACLLTNILPAQSSLLPAKPDAIRVLQLLKVDNLRPRYPDALPSILRELNEKTTANFDTSPLVVNKLDDETLSKHTFLYINYDDQPEIAFTEGEIQSLRKFLERGGFCYIDAGIKAEFIGTNRGHSFANWEVRPEVAAIFEKVFPGKSFRPLSREHDIFRCYYKGLPKGDKLPEAIRDFVENEKWPQGTYSFLGLHVEERLSVLVTPIIAMGWGKDESGNWVSPISFRIREKAEDARLQAASYTGSKFDASREDGLRDVIYSQIGQLPAWVEEPNGRWRIFRYYSGKEISDYANSFYTQLGVNIFVHALSN
jgi:hypothetical protein